VLWGMQRVCLMHARMALPLLLLSVWLMHAHVLHTPLQVLADRLRQHLPTNGQHGAAAHTEQQQRQQQQQAGPADKKGQ
jgi:hypothetical protein